ncbi:hypothetical protein SRABI06_05512 [Pseudomonas brassicacearum]|nr:hypothetical protein SRABI06_05512 [Pseudomonas brassicacearum]
MVRLGGKLQRQATGGIGGEVEQADAPQRAVTQLGGEATGRVRQGQLALGLGIGAEGGGEGLADRADFEEGLVGDRFFRVLGGDAIIEKQTLAVMRNRYRHTRDVLLFHQGLDDGIDRVFNAFLGKSCGRPAHQEKSPGEYRSGNVHGAALSLAFLEGWSI